jgi:hypothetical protein
MSTSQLLIAKESIRRVLEMHRSNVLSDENGISDSNEAYDTMSRRVWDAAELCIKQSFRNGIAEGSKCTANRNLLDVTHYLCARLTAMAEIMDARHDWSYGHHVIRELSETLQRMPFTEDEGAFVHRALEPLVVKYHPYTEGGHPVPHWIGPLLEALKKVPNIQPLATTTLQEG